jgi:LysR family hca operon transcriptional activator
VASESLVAVVASDHRFAAQKAVSPRDLDGEALISFTDVAHLLRDVVENYLRVNGVEISPSHHVDNFATAFSLVASTRSVALLPAYVEPLLPWSVVSRPLAGVPPTIDLAIGYRRDNASPVLKTLLARMS